MSYEKAKLVVEGLIEAGMVHPTAKYDIMMTMIAVVSDAEHIIIDSLSPKHGR